MVTRVLAKITKVRNSFINGKKKSKRILSYLFWSKAKSSGYEFAFEDLIFVVGSAAISVGATLEFAAFCSGPDANRSRASVFCFFLSTTMVFAAILTHFPTKTLAFSCR